MRPVRGGGRDGHAAHPLTPLTVESYRAESETFTTHDAHYADFSSHHADITTHLADVDAPIYLRMPKFSR